jgi:hypothetical protein
LHKYNAFISVCDKNTSLACLSMKNFKEPLGDSICYKTRERSSKDAKSDFMPILTDNENTYPAKSPTSFFPLLP